MADSKKDGRLVKIYVTTSDPGTETQERDPDNYTLFGLVTDIQWSSSTDMLDARDKDSAAGADDIVGDAAETATVSYNLALDGNAGHTIVHDAEKDGTLLYTLITTDVVSDYGRHFTAYIDSVDESAPDNEVVTGTASFKIQGRSTRFVINT